eukprot:scaffold260208_cov28-Tisochrysis_lutea.AAC.4
MASPTKRSYSVSNVKSRAPFLSSHLLSTYLSPGILPGNLPYAYYATPHMTVADIPSHQAMNRPVSPIINKYMQAKHHRRLCGAVSSEGKTSCL